MPGVATVIGPREQPVAARPPALGRRATHARPGSRSSSTRSRSAPQAIATFDRLRARVPALLARSGLAGARVSYAGDTALAQETVTAVRDDGFRVGAAVVLVNFVLLALFLRALWAPLYLLGGERARAGGERSACSRG